MKKHVLALLINISIITSVQATDCDITETCTQAPPCVVEGFYIASSTGVNFLQYQEKNSFKLDMSTGFFGDVCLGYRYQYWRLETELGFRHYDVRGYWKNYYTYRCGGYLDTTSVMANLILDLGKVNDPCKKWIPYYGIGVGYAHSHFHFCGIASNRDSVAYQHIFGLTYRMTENIDLGLEYRYFVPTENLVDHNIALTARKHF